MPHGLGYGRRGQPRAARQIGASEASARAYGGEIEDIIRFAMETAMCRGEIAAMKWEHVDRATKVLRVPETKTGEPRKVPLSTRALKVLDGLPRRIDGYVWGMRPDSITQAFERA